MYASISDLTLKDMHAQLNISLDHTVIISYLIIRSSIIILKQFKISTYKMLSLSLSLSLLLPAVF